MFRHAVDVEFFLFFFPAQRAANESVPYRIRMDRLGSRRPVARQGVSGTAAQTSEGLTVFVFGGGVEVKTVTELEKAHVECLLTEH